jgi:polysaccharide deacetylase 2 family uncharacterized protein YibQ
MKNKTTLYIALAILVTVVSFLVGAIFYQATLKKPKEPPHIDKVLEFDTTILEIKAREKTDVLSIATEIDDYMSSQKHKEENLSKPLLKPACKVVKKVPKRVKKVYHDKIPRLAIIMDDIGNANQVRDFKNIPFVITPSIFPSTKRHPNTPQFAKEFEHYMVHMPMEAFHFSRPEINTLQVSDSSEVVEEKIASMYQDFPDAIAINNHTGSKFTSSAEAMDRLFCALDKYDITFIDSKTAPHTKGKEVGALHNKIVLERHIFLDNEPDVDYILNQLQKAVRYAKRHGVAIAICHPRPETFEAFKEAAYLLEGVKMVTIDELL